MNEMVVDFTRAEKLPQMVWETDRNGVSQFKSLSWRQYVGNGPPDTAGEDWLRYYHPEDREAVQAAWQRSFETEGRTLYDVEARIRRHDGQYRWFRIQGWPIRDAEGRAQRWTGRCTDIDEQKRSATALKRLPPQQPEGHSPPKQDSGLLAFDYLSVALKAIIPLLLLAVIARITYVDAQAVAVERLVRVARIGVEHAGRVIETNKVIAKAMIAWDDEAIARRPREVSEQLKRYAEDLPQIQSLWIWDARGRPLASSRFFPVPAGLNIADREYFTHLQEHPDDWFVSEPLASRTTGERFIDVSRRRVDERNGFAGVVSTSLRPDYFASFYREMTAEEPGLTLSLIRSDGTVLARYPQGRNDQPHLAESSPILKALGEGQSTGTAAGRSTVDGIERVAAYSSIPGFPVFVVASAKRGAMLAAWRTNTAALATIAIPASVGLAWLAWLAARRARREHGALVRLEREVDQRNRAEEALRQAQKLEAMGLLTGSVAHDFNNLLMIISNNLYLQKRLYPEVLSSREHAAMTRAVESGTQLTRQLLAFARRQPLAPATIALQAFLPSLADLLRTSVSRHVALEISVSADTPPVFVDSAELELALLNIVMNARDAMPPSGGRVTIDAYGTALPGAVPMVTIDAYGTALPGAVPMVTIKVCDTGPGIPAELLERVFEPFFSTKEPGRGTGLGLTQVYGFCTAAGGRVSISSQPGEGTCVHMELPVAEGAPSAAPPAQPRVPDKLRGKVLLVEDMVQIAETTSRVLAAAGCDVEIVTSAQEACRLLDAGAARYDLVLSDIRMPGTMTGAELARLIRQRWPSLPVVLMTGYATDLDGPLAEGIPVLAKPVDPAVLIATLGRWLAATPPTGHPAAQA